MEEAGVYAAGICHVMDSWYANIIDNALKLNQKHSVSS